jgi:hypothetical protein
VQVSGTASGGAGIKLSGSGADLVGNTFVNAVLESNTTNDVSIASGVTDTRFIAGKLTASKVSDSGTGTRFFLAGEMFGPAAFGRNSTQHFLASGDGSGNYITGVSVSGQAKPAYFDADANSGAVRLRTRAAQPIEFYINDAVKMRLENNGAAFYGTTDNTTTLGKPSFGWSGLYLSSTVTAPGTTGNQTINKPTGRVNIAAAGSSITVTNNLVSTSSHVIAWVATNDSTALIKNVVPGSGSFVVTLNAATTGETAIGFLGTL